MNTIKRDGRTRRALPIALMMAALFVAGTGRTEAQLGNVGGVNDENDPPPDVASEVTLSLGRAEARPGERARLILSVETAVPLQSIRVALDFDESVLQFVGGERVGEQDGVPEPLPVDDALAGAAFNNVDEVTGDQPEEGWVFIEIGARDAPVGPEIDTNRTVALLGVDFLVLEKAPAGFSPVRFAVVGPDTAPDAAVDGLFRNEVVLAEDFAAANRLAVPDDNLRSGGIKVIGEVGFMRGDTTYDYERGVVDPMATLFHLFVDHRWLPCQKAADADDDGEIRIADALFTLNVLFLDGGPFPEPDKWGYDPTPDNLTCWPYGPTTP